MAGNHQYGPYDRGEIIAEGLERDEVVALLGKEGVLNGEDRETIHWVNYQMPEGVYTVSKVAPGYACSTSSGRGRYHKWERHGILQIDQDTERDLDYSIYRLAFEKCES